MFWFDNKKLSSEVDVISWKSLKKKTKRKGKKILVYNSSAIIDINVAS